MDALRAALAGVPSTRPDALARLGSATPFARTLFDVREHGHSVAVEVNRNYVSTLYMVEKSGVLYGFFASDKLEPYVIVCAIGDRGRLHRLTRAQLDALVAAIGEFKARFGVAQEQYHYTPLAEREETDRFVRGGGGSMRAKSHSSHFHLKIRIATRMYTDVVPALAVLPLAAMRESLEPVRYNYSREATDWAQTLAALQADALP